MQAHTQELRHCKAWQLWPVWCNPRRELGDIFYNVSAGKARYQFLRYCDCEMTFTDITVRRAKDHDKYLPARHWIADCLSKEQQQIVSHAFGVGHRSYFNCSPGNLDLLKLVNEWGLFTGPHYEWSYFEKQWNHGQGDWFGCYYYLTWLGKEVAKSMLPLDYDRLHEYQDCCFVRPGHEV